MIVPSSSLHAEKLRRVGTLDDYDMNVDGSTIPVYFISEFKNDETEFVVTELSFGILGGKLKNPLAFSGMAQGLTNGVEFGVYDKSGRHLNFFVTIKNNIEINTFFPNSNIVDYTTKDNDVLRGLISNTYFSVYPTRIIHGFYIKIQDDLSSLDWFQSVIKGFYQH